MAGHVGVVNAGARGTALALVLAQAGYTVRLWCRRSAPADAIRETHATGDYLPRVRIPPDVVALATGASDGLRLGDNSRAALITRSLVEIGRLVQAAGGDPRTVAGLAGLGDVVLTCTSEQSRNHWAGEQIAHGRTLEQVLARTRQVGEGVPAAQAAVAVA